MRLISQARAGGRFELLEAPAELRQAGSVHIHLQAGTAQAHQRHSLLASSSRLPAALGGEGHLVHACAADARPARRASPHPWPCALPAPCLRLAREAAPLAAHRGRPRLRTLPSGVARAAAGRRVAPACQSLLHRRDRASTAGQPGPPRPVASTHAESCPGAAARRWHKSRPSVAAGRQAPGAAAPPQLARGHRSAAAAGRAASPAASGSRQAPRERACSVAKVIPRSVPDDAGRARRAAGRAPHPFAPGSRPWIPWRPALRATCGAAQEVARPCHREHKTCTTLDTAAHSGSAHGLRRGS
eukprot:scaffold5181_cov370-Prasinococcus_capsulatus_cf.AAC.4